MLPSLTCGVPHSDMHLAARPHLVGKEADPLHRRHSRLKGGHAACRGVGREEARSGLHHELESQVLSGEWSGRPLWVLLLTTPCPSLPGPALPSHAPAPPGVHASPRSTSLASSWVTQMPSLSPRPQACTARRNICMLFAFFCSRSSGSSKVSPTRSPPRITVPAGGHAGCG